MSVIIAHTSNLSLSGGVVCGPIDTTGSTAIYIFGWGVFGVFQPSTGFDSYGNTWVLVGNPFSTCNGGLSGYRCFNPVCGPGHTFGLVPGLNTYGTEIAVVAMRPVDPTGTWALRRTQAASGQNPIQPGVFSPPAPAVANYVIVAAGMAGCGLTPVGVDSGFILLEALPQMGMAYQVLASVPPTLNPTWTTLVPGGTGGSTGAALMEGMGVYNGPPPPFPPVPGPGPAPGPPTPPVPGGCAEFSKLSAAPTGAAAGTAPPSIPGQTNSLKSQL